MNVLLIVTVACFVIGLASLVIDVINLVPLAARQKEGAGSSGRAAENLHKLGPNLLHRVFDQGDRLDVVGIEECSPILEEDDELPEFVPLGREQRP